ncbi:MAG: hypothetical protein J6M16_06850 [Clostridia bacterium]|nr:hypothetical protein [Clostridia bacterium]
MEKKNKIKPSCEICMNYYYDEEYDAYLCAINLDEDEVVRISSDSRYVCPYFRMGDDYTIVRKQN